MPSNPEITAALRAACEWMDANCGDAACVDDWRHDAAGTIAAFCEHLAAAGAKHGLIETTLRSIYTGDLARLAAAVEAAAHE